MLVARARVLGGQPPQTLGAAILVAPGSVLTCRHVLADANGGRTPEEFLVDFPDSPAADPAKATVSRSIPAIPGHSRDLALLELASPASSVPARWADRVDEPVVRVFGYPAGLPVGVWVRALLTDEVDERTGWRRLDRRGAECGPDEGRDTQPIERGYSGAAAFDAAGSVVGMVVVRTPPTGRAETWLIPSGQWQAVLSGSPRPSPTGRRPLSFAQKHVLSHALGNVPVLTTPEGRRLLLQTLPPHIRAVVPTHPTARLELFALLDTVLEFDEGFPILLATVAALAGPDIRAVATVRRLACDLGLLEA
ncbi:effector-associated domain 2-containing protein [Phytohabitans kaempferiae]|uniref:Trypsin-like peptidase domain-containing protein n=1 Tax=Phytohabitans kaempferiae TaxID=1620943 RepID=A0ABV6M1U6_9ACTN